MKVLITGKNGQVGQAVINCKPIGIELIETDKLHLDISNRKECIKEIKYHNPDWVINCAAYTSVDKAEDEPMKAKNINRNGPKYIAEAIKETKINLLHLSTDFVFNGKQNKAYKPNQLTSPIGIYGKTKAEGEEEIKKTLAKDNKGIILRTSWVMGVNGYNFAKTILKLNEKKEKISVVSDQIASPTNAPGLAKACWKIIECYSKPNFILPSILHWTDSGVASWFDIAVAIGEIGEEIGLLKKRALVIPIKSEEYQTKAKRPIFSCLDCESTSKIIRMKQMYWRDGLKEVLKGIHSNKISGNIDF